MLYFTELLSPVLRWVHIVAGIAWIGHLYFFNFVNAHVAALLDADTKKKLVPELMPRALWWFRMGAAWTWITGILLLALVFYHGGIQFEADTTYTTTSLVLIALTFVGVFIYDAVQKAIANEKMAVIYCFILLSLLLGLYVEVGHFSYRASQIHLGALFGSIMAFNVWFRIWPAQQKIISAVKAGTAPDASLVKLAGLRSKQNTYLSVPLIWTMINQHTYFLAGSPYLTLAIFLVAGLTVHQLFKKSKFIKGF